MPKRPPRMCAKQWCRNYAIENTYYCEEHKPIRTDEREPANQRGYDSHWTKFRSMYLRQHPVCVRCGRMANVVHHIIPLDEGGEKFSEDNLMALCRYDHEKIHGRAL